MGCATCKSNPPISCALLANPWKDRFSANSKAKELLARVKEDKIAEKKRLAPYYFGGFSHGANSSDTEGVHSKELEPYLNGSVEKKELTNGHTNGHTDEHAPTEAPTEVPKEPEQTEPTNGAAANEAPQEPQQAEPTNGATAIEAPKESAPAEPTNGIEAKETIVPLKVQEPITGSSIGVPHEH